eukprot:1391970-Amorphochlora_amoeboformis.AAC.3
MPMLLRRCHSADIVTPVLMRSSAVSSSASTTNAGTDEGSDVSDVRQSGFLGLAFGSKSGSRGCGGCGGGSRG